MTARKRTVLLTSDEAIGQIVEALDAASSVLAQRQSFRTVSTLLNERPTRRLLSKPERSAVARYRRALASVRSAGHGDLIVDQVSGYLSALECDPGFRGGSFTDLVDVR